MERHDANALQGKSSNSLSGRERRLQQAVGGGNGKRKRSPAGRPRISSCMLLHLPAIPGQLDSNRCLRVNVSARLEVARAGQVHSGAWFVGMACFTSVFPSGLGSQPALGLSPFFGCGLGIFSMGHLMVGGAK